MLQSIIDPHCHLWDLVTFSRYYPWLQDTDNALLGKLQPIQRNYYPKDLLLDSNNLVTKFIHIEAASMAYAQAELDWLLALAKTQPKLAGIVAGIDFLAADLHDTLERYQQDDAKTLVKGVRQIMNYNGANNKYSAEAQDLLTHPTWRENFRLLANTGLIFEAQVCPQQLIALAQLASDHPETIFVLNHAGFPIMSDIDCWQTGITACAQQSNIQVKLSGFGMMGLNYSEHRAQIAKIIDMLLMQFGIERCLFASNFPVEKLYASYQSVFDAYQAAISHLSVTEQSQLFYSNAERIYKIF